MRACVCMWKGCWKGFSFIKSGRVFRVTFTWIMYSCICRGLCDHKSSCMHTYIHTYIWYTYMCIRVCIFVYLLFLLLKFNFIIYFFNKAQGCRDLIFSRYESVLCVNGRKTYIYWNISYICKCLCMYVSVENNSATKYAIYFHYSLPLCKRNVIKWVFFHSKWELF